MNKLTNKLNKLDIKDSTYDKLSYLKNKIKEEKHECKIKNECNVCWWKNVTISPNLIPECRHCLEDMETFRSLAGKYSKINFEPKCNIYCLWWTWFHNKRKMFGIDFVYIRK